MLEFAAACASKGKSESTTAAGETEQAAHGSDHGAGGDVALCTDKAAVPMDATKCRLYSGTGVDTYWLDTDGVDPGTAGSHNEYTDAACGEVKTGRALGE